jgi:hypothetical protein
MPGAAFYVAVLRRYLAKGVTHIRKDMKNMVGRKELWEAFDGLKKRYNIFAKLFPRSPTPTPTRPPPATEDGERRPPRGFGGAPPGS